MTDRYNILNYYDTLDYLLGIKPNKSNNDVWDDWVKKSKDYRKAHLKENIKNLVYKEGVLGEQIIMNFNNGYEQLKILNLILNHCDNEKPRDISTERALEILSKMESNKIRESEYDEYDIEDDEDDIEKIIAIYKMHKIEDFLKEVDEYLSPITTKPTEGDSWPGNDRWRAELPQNEREENIRRFIFDKKTFMDIMINDPDHPECKKILKAIITYWGSEKHKDLSVETALKIASEMEPISSVGSYKKKKDGTWDSTVKIEENEYDIEKFLKKVEEYRSFKRV